MRPLHKSACLEKTAHFDEISNSSEPAYAGRPIGGERESKDREMGVFNKHDHLCNGLKVIKFLLMLLLFGCGYHFEGSEQSTTSMTTISVPYIKGDREGQLNTEIVRALSASGQFDCVQSGGMWILEAAIVAESDDRIGFRYDRDPTSGHLRDNIVGTENRRTINVQISLIDGYTSEVVLGPQIVKAFADYDYVDSNSVRDLTFIGPHGAYEKVLDFSLGQLDSIEGAHDDSAALIYRILAQKIVDGIIAKSACNDAALPVIEEELVEEPTLEDES